MTKTAFILCAGLGTRFRPHTNFLPKPALPFFGLPQVLYPTALLKSISVENFVYNSHHLPVLLDEHLYPHFKTKGIYEKELLDSAGGIANAKSALSGEENFWVVNGDSFITSQNSQILEKAYDFHCRNGSIATLIGVPKENPNINGLGHDHMNRFTHLGKGSDCLHFIGLYIFNKRIFEFIRPEKSHIFLDVLLNNFPEKALVFNAEDSLSWFETGNEADFIACHKKEAENLLELKECSPVAFTYKTWGLSFESKLSHFSSTRVWGPQYCTAEQKDFLVLPDQFTHRIENVQNCVVVKDLDLPKNQNFSEKVLIDSSQWT